MLESFLAIMSSSGVGALAGGLFGWLNKREDRKTRKSDQAFELDRIRAQSSADTTTSEARAFEESQKTLSRVADAIKAMVRPIITGALLWMVYRIMMQLETLTGGIQTFPAEMAIDLYREIVLNIICLASTAVSWWFASRPSSVARSGK